jgi:hypothetical protein
MNIILVCLKNFQEYILINIQQLIKLNHSKIFVITNKILNHYFEKYINEYNDIFKIINVEEIIDEFNFNQKTTLDKQFRSGFWSLTSERFFYIYSAMKKYNIDNVIHIENDVLLYYNSNILDDKLNKNKIYLPFDTFTRNIASIMYIPNHNVFKSVLDLYDFNQNDMFNFSRIKKQTGLIYNFPIFINNNLESSEYKFVTENFEKFNFIFDAAAIGQYLGGVDPRNIEGNSVGFINETCIIKYNNYNFLWENIENIRKPFIFVNNLKIPVFNLHIHCKNLQKFI